MSKKEENNFPGPGPEDEVIIKFVAGLGPQGRIIGIFDDAYVLQQEDKNLVVCMKAAIESIWIREEQATDEKKEGEQ